MHYFITGHTGFKGAWLTELLLAQGHQVSGLALDPLAGSLFEVAHVSKGLTVDVRADIRDRETLAEALRHASPDVVVHMAAQPLVRESYRVPRETFDVNVMGTLSVLEACSDAPSAHAIVIVTTDKVYENVDRIEGYREDEPLGAADPYSTSKAMADLLTQSWVKSFPGAPTVIARAGNVIGGGDVSADRLIPDLVRSFARGDRTMIRNPGAVRPWQHVLDCVAGYVRLADAVIEGTATGAWNFGPGPEGLVTVGEIADRAAALWGDGAGWDTDTGDHPHEANLLSLDASRARDALQWRDLLPYPTGLEWTIEWERRRNAGEDPGTLTRAQIHNFLALD
jgi:CDP-glucose 4,6-dehydratase